MVRERHRQAVPEDEHAGEVARVAVVFLQPPYIDTPAAAQVHPTNATKAQLQAVFVLAEVKECKNTSTKRPAPQARRWLR